MLFGAQIKEKRAIYEEECKRLGAHFVPFVVTSDFCLSEPAEGLLDDLAEDLSKRWGKSKGLAISWLRSNIALAIARGASACVRGGREKPRAAGAAMVEDGAPVQGVFSRE